MNRLKYLLLVIVVLLLVGCPDNRESVIHHHKIVNLPPKSNNIILLNDEWLTFTLEINGVEHTFLYHRGGHNESLTEILER